MVVDVFLPLPPDTEKGSDELPAVSCARIVEIGLDYFGLMKEVKELAYSERACLVSQLNVQCLERQRERAKKRELDSRPFDITVAVARAFRFEQCHKLSETAKVKALRRRYLDREAGDHP
jgi:hypothetical protein